MSDFIILKNVRVSFPHLFTAPMINGKEGKCGAVLLMDPAKHAEGLTVVKTQIAGLIKERFKGVALPSDKLCLRKGEDKGRPEYAGYVVLSANNKTPVPVVGADGKQITDEKKNPVYAGCYIDAKIRLWAQDNQYGKRINAELIAVKFVADGEPLDSSYVSVEEAVEGFAVTDEADDFLNVA